MTTMTLDQIFDLTQQLPREQRRLLILRMERELAYEVMPKTPPMTREEAEKAIEEIRQTIAALPQPRLTAGEQLEANRREREYAILGLNKDEID